MTSPLIARFSPDWPHPFAAPVAVLLLHGFGSHEHDLADLGPQLSGDLPWASLQAPLQLGPGSHAWFPILTPGDPSSAVVEPATQALWSWVDAHLPTTTTILPVGFSQGGVMASELLRTRPERVAGVALLSGFVQATPRAGDATLAASRPPVFWGRGADDPIITRAAIDRTGAWLPAHATLEERVYAHVGHSIGPREIADVRAYLATVAAAAA